ncbi:PQQ-dependent sugar dehydrogenase [Phytoactinopolyspora limicola]|uniref:PQQ-dependent sugar dehydrogenase n=1 Tax=Phytoactinopolyspora limicola TaxID=2715536 RepID=UPI00140AF2B5|nr:PQQ-dependent sugar dehydrogenase [Phytoactinopolyspora limicola]
MSVHSDKYRTRRSLFALVTAASLPLAVLLGPVPAGAADSADPAPPATAHHHPEPDWDVFEKVTLTREVGEPMSMAVLPDRRVLHTNRQGQFRLYDPHTSSTRIITSLPVYQFSEDGMQGIALDPDFENNHWVYVYYSPVIPGIPDGPAPDEVEPGDEHIFDQWQGHNTLSRFTFVDDPVNPYIDLDSEQQILDVPINRGLCCHNGGDIGFDSAGNLYLSTGDDANPFQSQEYSPIDVRPGRNPGFDAQRSSANTADLRGKLLRITVNEDGSYDVPAGNMFTEGEWDHLFPDGVYDPELARPEIYAMGFRNPFRFSVDPVTDTVYLADYGPDAREPDPARGPRGTVTWHIIDSPRNVGWPYCIGNNFAYVEYDFATGESGDPFDCANGPVNTAPLNTGLEQLPPVTPAEVWYHNYIPVPEFPELGSGGGGGPMGGPVYQYDESVAAEHPTAFPEEFDGVPLFYEWMRDYIKQFHLTDDRAGLDSITDMLPTMEWNRPMDMEWGPDGSLYVLEYGGGFFVEHPLAQLSRVDYVLDGRSPAARVAANPRSGQAPLEVAFSSAGTHHPEDGGEIVDYLWTFGDGATSDATDPVHTYTDEGIYPAMLTVTDADGRTGQASVTIVVGNTAPEVELELPVDGGFFDWGDEVAYRIDVTDVEDEQISCDDVVLNSALGHAGHAHPISEHTGCSGTFVTAQAGHGANEDIYWVLTARYTDQGAGGLPPLTGLDQVTLQPKRKQAEYFVDAHGVTTASAGDPAEGGNQRLAQVNHGDWAAYEPINLLNVDEIQFRVRSSGAGGTIEIRQDAPDGPLLGAADVPDTAEAWTFVAAEVDDPGATLTAYLVFTNPAAPAGAELFTVNFFQAVGEGVAGPPPPPRCDGSIVLGVADSGVADRDSGHGGCVSELLDDGREWRHRGEFVAHVTDVTQQLVDEGVITRGERASLIRAAAGSGIGGRS